MAATPRSWKTLRVFSDEPTPWEVGKRRREEPWMTNPDPEIRRLVAWEAAQEDHEPALLQELQRELRAAGASAGIVDRHARQDEHQAAVGTVAACVDLGPAAGASQEADGPRYLAAGLPCDRSQRAQ